MFFSSNQDDAAGWDGIDELFYVRKLILKYLFSWAYISYFFSPTSFIPILRTNNAR